MKILKEILFVLLISTGLAYSIICTYEGNLWYIIGIVISYILMIFLFVGIGFENGFEIGFDRGEQKGKGLGQIEGNIEGEINKYIKEQQDEFEISVKNKLISKYIYAFKNNISFGVGNECSYLITSILNKGEESIVTFEKIKNKKINEHQE